MAESMFCAGCSRGEAWCCECSKVVCKACSRFHQKLSPPHKVIPTEKLGSLSSPLMTLSRNCEIHNDHELILFCCQHDQLICSSCVPESHQNCEPLMPIEVAAKDVHRGTTLSNLETRIDNLTQIMEKILNLYGTQILSLDERTSGFKQTVADIKRNIISHLDRLEAEFNKELDRKYNECNDTLIKNKADIQERYDTLTTWRKDMISLQQHTSNVQLFHAIKHLDDKTNREETRVRNFKTDTLMPTLHFKLAIQMSKIHDILPSFGDLSVDNSPIPTSTNLDIDQQGQTVVRSPIPKRPIPLVRSFKTSKLGDCAGIWHGCFVADNKLLLCDQDENKIYFCDCDGSNAKTINLYHCPYAVTLYDRNKALVSAAFDSIQIINMNTLKLGKRIKVGSYYRAITSLNGNIWVNSDDNTLTMVDIKGRVQKKVTISASSYNICLSKDGNMYCTNFDSDDVYVVTPDEEEHVFYSSPELSNAMDITVDDYGDVYIAGRDSHNVHRISSDGKQSKIILCEEDGILHPSGLSYNHQTKELMVVSNGSSINFYKVR